MTTPDANKSVVRQYVKAFDRGDTDGLRAVFTADAVVHGVLGSAGIDAALSIWQELHHAYRIELTVDDMVAEGDRVAVRYTERGRFVGPFRGQEPTGKAYQLVAMEWFAFRDGRVQARWGARDSAALARQVGAAG